VIVEISFFPQSLYSNEALVNVGLKSLDHKITLNKNWSLQVAISCCCSQLCHVMVTKELANKT